MDLQAIDEGASFALHGIHRGGLNEVMSNLTFLGDEKVVYPVAAVGILILLARQKIALALALIVVCLATWQIGERVKDLVQRKRPDLPDPVVRVPASPSFPSSHALRPAAIYMGLALIAARRLRPPWKSYLLLGGTFLFVILIGFTRLYLCVHWLSDVLAGWAVGFGLAFLLRGLDERWNPSAPISH
ncbi:MAG: phosphatase PAP2 family protein [Gemmataceae bacterium]